MRTTQFDSLEPRTFLSTYYVSPTGSDSAAGTSSAPWKTLQNAANHASAGDMVDVRAGTYVGFNMTRSGTSSAPITFAADAGAVINQPNSNADGINLESASYVTVRGFTLNGLRAGIRSVTNTGVQILNNKIDRCEVWGIFTGFSSNVLIENNITSNSVEQHGIYVSNSADNPTIRGNTSFGNHECGIQINADASEGGDGIITGAMVENNIIYSNGTGGGSGINLDAVQVSTIRNNLLYDNHASGISLYHMDGADGAKNNLLVNNTIVMANNSGSAGRYAVNILNGSTGNVVVNNILYSYFPRSGGAGSISVASDSTSGFRSDYNIVSDTNAFDRGTSSMNFASWKSASGQDAHSIVAAPAQIFSNASAYDFRLKTGSTAIDRGTMTMAATPATDILGTRRPSGNGIDIGAYEQPSKVVIITLIPYKPIEGLIGKTPLVVI